MTYSSNTTSNVMPAHIHMNFEVKGGSLLNCCTSNARKHSGGPGRKGSTQPTMPTSNKITPTTIQSVTIYGRFTRKYIISTMLKINQIHHIAIISSDYQVSKKFY